ncbi:hypothetical protein EG68_12159 [Paragonimus skrjabini miyazakii]|uniref:Uncharacterized protein n=1 Tax=Paragonimus skrjabini miyazakii TaxID=59628 RepID=A0A8S9YDC6_9TREM|nr:hypothetical protein EG68_12159 [Paragonimus skrjabini miyazakii]
MDDSATGSSASSVQPRWMKKPGTGLPCGCCGGPVQIDGYRCDADQLTFHSGCIEMADINECPFCGQQLRPQSPAIGPTPAEIVKSKSRAQPTTDVDLDEPGDVALLEHGQKKARICITLSDYQPDIIENIRHDERFNDESFI